MPKKLHSDIRKSVEEAHPSYSAGRVERETNAVMTNIGKGMVRKGKKMGYPTTRHKRTATRKSSAPKRRARRTRR